MTLREYAQQKWDIEITTEQKNMIDKIFAPSYKFNIDDLVKITEEGAIYNQYETFVKKYANEYLDYWEYNSIFPNLEAIYKIIVKECHLDALGVPVYIIQSTNTNIIYVVGEDAIEKI